MPNDHEPLSYDWMKEEHRRGTEALGWIVFIVAPFWIAWKAIQLLWAGVLLCFENPWLFKLLLIPVGIIILVAIIASGSTDYEPGLIGFVLFIAVTVAVASTIRQRRNQ